MIRKLIFGLSFILLSIGFYHATYSLIPNFVYYKFQQKAQNLRGQQVNEFSYIMAPDENARMVVKPNPDFAYASAFFDLSDGPIRLTGSMPDSTYWSVAMYEPNTVNFYIKNDIEFGTDNVNLILGLKKTDTNIDVISNVQQGFILIRLLIKERSPVIQDQMMAYLKTLKIETL